MNLETTTEIKDMHECRGSLQGLIRVESNCCYCRLACCFSVLVSSTQFSVS